MQDSLSEILRAWQNFYMLAGGASASLMGLVFVAASLATRLVDPDIAVAGVRAFVTPIIIHFSAVLVISMLVMIPAQTSGSFGGLLGAGGMIGLGYAVTTGVQLWRHHRKHTRVVRADWLWRACLPGVGYLLILGAVPGLLTRTAASLNGLAFAVVILLLLGIRNAWDLFLWIARQRLRSN